MQHRIFSNFLDAASGTTIILGFITGQQIAIFLGCLASIMAIINHGDQYYTRKYKKDKKQNI